ncbi:MAG: hypothetical protein Q7O66_04005 [Dehalococcoidia bacterium]|nr:hypothetical protein [Dehalococcoidia bacterium]
MTLLDIIKQAGWPESEWGNTLGVISLESGGNTNAHNTNGEDSRGLYQINVGPGAHTQWASLNLYDPTVNASRAYQLYSAAGNYRDWWNAAGTLGLPPRGNYRHAVEEFASLANKEMGTGGGGTTPLPGSTTPPAESTVGLVVVAGLVALALIVWG